MRDNCKSAKRLHRCQNYGNLQIYVMTWLFSYSGPGATTDSSLHTMDVTVVSSRDANKTRGELSGQGNPRQHHKTKADKPSSPCRALYRTTTQAVSSPMRTRLNCKIFPGIQTASTVAPTGWWGLPRGGVERLGRNDSDKVREIETEQ